MRVLETSFYINTHAKFYCLATISIHKNIGSLNTKDFSSDLHLDFVTKTQNRYFDKPHIDGVLLYILCVGGTLSQ